MTEKRYTLDMNQAHPDAVILFKVLDNGKETEAWASEEVDFPAMCEIKGGKFWGGTFNGGEFYDGHFLGGEFWEGIAIYGGKFWDGYFQGGVYHKGNFRKGWFCGGEFHGGEFHGGEFHGGEFYNGIFEGGFYNGGEFYDGRFTEGVFWGGRFEGGTFKGGKYKKGWLPVQIQGSKHFVNCSDGEKIVIGCEEHYPEGWLEYGLNIAAREGYSEKEIEEYEGYILFVKSLIEKTKLKTEN